jgi:hypothetical protein
MAGEFVRTPKKGTSQGRYSAAADLPMIEIALCLVSGASTVASIETGHWFAAPFAMLFTFGYGWVAFFVAAEQVTRRKAQLARPATASQPPPALLEARGQAASPADELAA